MSDYSKYKFTNPFYDKKLGRTVESNLNEADGDDNSSSASTDTARSEDQLRIEACKLSQKISKLMNNVSPADMLEIANACLKYIKYQKAGEDYDPTYGLEDADKESDNDLEDNYELDDDKEDTSENGSIDFEDNFDFGDDFTLEDEPETKEKKNSEDEFEI